MHLKQRITSKSCAPKKIFFEMKKKKKAPKKKSGKKEKSGVGNFVYYDYPVGNQNKQKP